jgi:hypothetical protein
MAAYRCTHASGSTGVVLVTLPGPADDIATEPRASR